MRVERNLWRFTTDGFLFSQWKEKRRAEKERCDGDLRRKERPGNSQQGYPLWPNSPRSSYSLCQILTTSTSTSTRLGSLYLGGICSCSLCICFGPFIKAPPNEGILNVQFTKGRKYDKTIHVLMKGNLYTKGYRCVLVYLLHLSQLSKLGSSLIPTAHALLQAFSISHSGCCTSLLTHLAMFPLPCL